MTRVHVYYEIDEDYVDSSLRSIREGLKRVDPVLKKVEIRVGREFGKEIIWTDPLAPPQPPPPAPTRDVHVTIENIEIHQEADLDALIERLNSLMRTKVTGTL